MSTTRLVIQNSFLNFIASVSQRIGQTIIFILVARLLTAESAGALKLANTYTSILLTFSLWGLDHILIREVAKDRETAGRYLGGFLGLRVILAIILWCGLILLMPILPYTSESKRLILIMTASIIPGSISNLYQSIWVALEDVKPTSAVFLFFSLVRVGAGTWLLWRGEPLTAMAYLFLLATTAEMSANAWLTHRRPELSTFSWRPDLPFWIENLKIAAPLIAVSFILIVEYQFDAVILSLFRPEDEVGVYGTAATILALLLFLTRSYQLAIFPVLSRAYHSGQASLQNVYGKSMKYLLLGALPITLLVSLWSGYIIRSIFGPGYEEAGKILSVLVWAFYISALNVCSSRLLIVANRQRLMATFAFMSMGGNLLLSLWLVPRFGGIGTAWARVLAMPLYSIPTLYYVQRYICPLSWRGWWRVGLSRLKEL